MLCLWLYVLTLSFSGSVSAQNAATDPYESLTAFAALYEVQIPNVAAATLKVYDTDADDFLIPVGPLFDLLGVRYTIDYSARSVSVNGETLHLSGRGNVTSADSLYVALSSVASALKIIARLDRSDARVVLLNTDELPVVKRAARARAREQLLARSASERRSSSVVPPVVTRPESGYGSLSADYRITQYRSRWGSFTDYTVSASTPVAQGALLMHASGVGKEYNGELTWIRAWPMDREPTQLLLGYGMSSGIGSLPINGLVFSNAPWVRPQLHNMLYMTGVLPQDWSIEAYKNGLLIGFDSVGSTGAYNLSIPLTYGENSVNLIAYGPGGQTIHLDRIIRARPAMLPEKAFEFGGSTGMCSERTCSWMMNVDLRYGLSSMWTIRGGASEFSWKNGNPTSIHPYFAIDGLVRPGLSINLEGIANASARLGVAWDPLAAVSVVGDYARYKRTDAGELLSGGAIDQAWLATRILPGFIRYPVEGQFMKIRYVDHDYSFLRIGTSLNLYNSMIRPYFRRSVSGDMRSTTIGADAVSTPAGWGFSGLHRWWVKGNLESRYDGRGLENAELTFARSGAGNLSVEAGIKWHRNYQEPRLTLGLSREMGDVLVQGNSTAGLSGEMAAVNYSVGGSIRWDAQNRRLSRYPHSRLESAGVSGVVFLDLNGNNKLDPGEDLIEGAVVRVEHAQAGTDKVGYFEVWGVPGGQFVGLEVDASSMPSPWWVPVNPITYVPTSPRRAVSVRIPIAIGGIIEGTMTADSTLMIGAIEIIHLPSGRKLLLEPFSDGTFYMMGLLTGEYEARANGVKPVRFKVYPMTTTKVDIHLEGDR